jgi:putative transposase
LVAFIEPVKVLLHDPNIRFAQRQSPLLIRKWRLKHRAVADSLEEAGDRLFTFARLPPSQWRSLRTTNAIERLHEEFKRRIKTQTVLPSADTAAMMFWALLASGQINMRKVDGWQTLATKPIDQPIDLAA